MKNYWIRRRWLDFRQGHGMYLIFALSFTNFVLIFHRLLIERVDFLDDIFSNLWFFAIVFVVMYIPVAILIGFWHRRTQVKIETEQGFRNNPFMAKIFRMLADMIDGRASKEEIKKFRDLLMSIESGKAGMTESSSK